MTVRRLIEAGSHLRGVVGTARWQSSQGVQYDLSFISESAKHQDDLGRDGIDGVADFGIVQQHIDELGNLQLINLNGGLIFRRNDSSG